MPEVKSSEKINPDLEKVWEGINKEFYYYKKKTLGNILTILGAVITNETQFENIKDLVTKAVWENENPEFMMGHWLNWLQACNNIIPGDYKRAIPMHYQGPPVPSLEHFREK